METRENRLHETVIDDVVNDYLYEEDENEFKEMVDRAKEELKGQIESGADVIVIYVCPDNNVVEVEPQSNVQGYLEEDGLDYEEVQVNHNQVIRIYKD